MDWERLPDVPSPASARIFSPTLGLDFRIPALPTRITNSKDGSRPFVYICADCVQRRPRPMPSPARRRPRPPLHCQLRERPVHRVQYWQDHRGDREQGHLQRGLRARKRGGTRASGTLARSRNVDVRQVRLRLRLGGGQNMALPGNNHKKLSPTTTSRKIASPFPLFLQLDSISQCTYKVCLQRAYGGN